MRVSLHRTGFPKFALSYLPPTLLTLFLWSTSDNDVTLISFICALVLLILPWYTYQQWRRGSREDLPLFSMISIIYWLYYAFPLFWGERTVLQADVDDRLISESSITLAMVMVLLGVFSLMLGLRSRIGGLLKPSKLPYINLSSYRLHYIRAILSVGILVNLFDPSPYVFGEGGRQIVLTLATLIPTIAFAILFREFMRGNRTRFDTAMIAAYLLSRFIAGLSSGWLGVFISIIITCAAIYITERKKIPALMLVVAVFFMLFFQVGKEEFRKTYWLSDEETGKIERMEFWVNASLAKWGDALSDPSSKTIKEATYPSVSRLALLTQAGNVIDMTPAVVPYQYGSLYTYLFIGMIPRFVWPDKPSVNEANQFYQVAYGLTDEDNLDRVAISVGILTEGFMNFSWFGVVLIMFLLGVFCDFYQQTFLSRASGILMNGIGFVLLPQFLAIESQLAVYMGGIIQTLFLTFLIMLPIISFKSRPSRVSARPALATR